MERLSRLTQALEGYGELVLNFVLVLAGGMLIVILLYKLVHAVIRPEGKYSRMVKVVFGAIYFMILVIAILLAAENTGHDVDFLAGPALLVVMVGAVMVFFIFPFLPRLPFLLGDMVEIRGVMGVVEQITPYHTVIRCFDGQTAFMPNALIMASPITNFSTVPQRRVALGVEINGGDDIERARQLLLEIMGGHEKVLADPEPAVFVTGVSGEKASLSAFCWVENADWFGTRDALWVATVNAFAGEGQVALARSQLDLRDVVA